MLFTEVGSGSFCTAIERFPEMFDMRIKYDLKGSDDDV
jgi:hypothetical protein